MIMKQEICIKVCSEYNR